MKCGHFLLLLGLISAPAWAWFGAGAVAPKPLTPNPDYQPYNPLCQAEETTTLSKVEVEQDPGYFFKPTPDGKFIFFAGPSGEGNRNYRLNLESGEVTEAYGEFDAVPTPDGKFITVPDVLERPSAYGGVFRSALAIFPANQIGPQAEPLFRDREANGVYQSTGLLTSDADRTTYRVLIGNGRALFYRDYVVSAGEKTEIKALPNVNGQDTVTNVCPGIKLSMPMLSKDGKRLAGVDDAKGKTKIFELEAKGGPCKEILDLGYVTGKVDFSFDGDQIAFHASENDSSLRDATDYLRTPSKTMVINTFVYNIKNKELTRITHNTSGSSRYPTFLADGRLVYLYQPESEEAETHPTFVIADPKRARAVPIPPSTSCADCKNTPRSKTPEAAVALGGLWSRVCSKWGNLTAPGGATLAALSLDPSQCRHLVSQYWKWYRSKILNEGNLTPRGSKIRESFLRDLTENDLLRACPSETKNTSVSSIPTNSPPVKPRRARLTESAPQETSTPQRDSTRTRIHNTSQLEEPSEPEFTFKSATGDPIRKKRVPASCLECHQHNWLRPGAKLKGKTAQSGIPLLEDICQRVTWNDAQLTATGRRKMPLGQPLSDEERKSLFEFLAHENGGPVRCELPGSDHAPSIPIKR